MPETTDPAFAKAEMLIRKPISEVFEAFIDPALTTKFWFSGSSGRVETGSRLNWTWEVYNHTETIDVKAVEPESRIVIEWGGAKKSTVEWSFKPLTGQATFVSIANSGFTGETKEIMDQIRESTEGFTIVLAGLKAWMEHRIQLNLVPDRFPEGIS